MKLSARHAEVGFFYFVCEYQDAFLYTEETSGGKLGNMAVYFITTCVIALLILLKVWKKQYLFILTITDGKPQLTHGTVNAEFIEDVQRICKLLVSSKASSKA